MQGFDAFEMQAQGFEQGIRKGGEAVFFAFAVQCMSTVAIMRRETGGWKWPALQFGYMLFLGYMGAFVAVRIF